MFKKETVSFKFKSADFKVKIKKTKLKSTGVNRKLYTCKISSKDNALEQWNKRALESFNDFLPSHFQKMYGKQFAQLHKEFKKFHRKND